MRITIYDLADDLGWDSVDDMLDAYSCESVLPALCSEGCEVEPDGTCEHGHPSLFLALLLI